MLNLRCLFGLNPYCSQSQCLHLPKYHLHLHYSTAVTSTASTSDSYSNYFVDLFGFSRQQALSISTKLSLKRRNKVFKDVVMKLGTTLDSPITESYANYFVDTLGFSRGQSLFISTRLYVRRKNKVIDFEFVENANSVVALFHNLGFDDTLLRNIVSKEPQLLASNVEKTLKPKIRLLQDEDFSRSDVIRVISSRPTILLYKMESTILPMIQILRQVLGSASNIVKAMERLTEIDFCNIVKCLLPNVALLSSYGVPIELIREQLLFQPRYLLQNPEVFKDVVMRDDKKLGITRH